jgi:two-component system response regulator AlgR
VAQRRAQEPLAAPAGPVLVVSDRGRVLRVPAAEVLYLKAEQKYVTLCSTRGTWLLDDALADLEQRLGEGFLRVHRNAVVAGAAVRALERRRGGEEAESGDGADTVMGSGGGGDEGGWQLQVANGDWLSVSRRQLPAVREVLARRA